VADPCRICNQSQQGRTNIAPLDHHIARRSDWSPVHQTLKSCPIGGHGTTRAVGAACEREPLLYTVITTYSDATTSDHNLRSQQPVCIMIRGLKVESFSRWSGRVTTARSDDKPDYGTDPGPSR
jgi:hypothetical protein